VGRHGGTSIFAHCHNYASKTVLRLTQKKKKVKCLQKTGSTSKFNRQGLLRSFRF
jgi:hypothetical protein